MRRRIYICPHCFAVSHNPNDIAQRYCGRCHRWGMDEEEEFALVAQLVEQARPLFAGRPRHVIGAALADLLAIWLASHYASDPTATQRLRSALLKMHVGKVRQLVPPNEAALMERVRATSH